MCLRNDVHAIGLQETRGIEKEVKDSDGFRVFSSAGVNGQLGCNVWLRKGSVWNLETCAVGACEPRLLCDFVKMGDVSCALIAAHAMSLMHGGQSLKLCLLVSSSRRVP